jgi:hypothetical protein
MTNPNSQSRQLAGGLSAEAYTLHLPLIVKKLVSEPKCVAPERRPTALQKGQTLST